MKDEDFQFCEFIDYNMSFITYDDFCKKCKLIKELYQPLSKYQKRFYKWYVYANIHMREVHKNAIWNYLNIDELQCYIELIKFRTLR